MKITNSDQQNLRNPELSKANAADNLTGKKKAVSKVAADKSAAIKTDTVQLSQKSRDLAKAAKSDGKTQTTTVQDIDENVLSKLLKMADKGSVIFGSSGIDASKETGEEIDHFI
jgi:hypothetical protein